MQVMDLFTSFRPRQWVKNLFVLAPLVFAKRANDPASLRCALVAFVLFCMASSSVYLFNDVADRERDRNHPEKRKRAIAAGRVSVRLAVVVSIVLACLSIFGGILVEPWLGLVLLGYLLLNLLYSTGVKHVPYLDVIFIASGFLLRVVGGALAIPVVISSWILLCTFFISIYLGLGKRLHELLLISPDGPVTRKVLSRYKARSTGWMMAFAGLAAWLAFLFYSMSDRVIENFGTRSLAWTTPLVALGQIRFARLIRRRNRPGSPTDAMVSDPLFLLVAFTWLAVTIFLVYLR
jgi:decaprenyl-phosphate phosphoribosyltransferase